MSSGRGAKGSIKDRLISMLYRLRYKKKELKEENYTISNKKKQENYVNTLQEFRESENIDLLDKKDKKALDKIKIRVNYKLFNKVKRGTDEELSLKLDSIEYKTSELNEVVNLKKEEKKTKDEIVILTEVKKFIDTSKKQLEEIKEDVKELKEESKIVNKDTKELEERYLKLKEKIEKLKKQFNIIKEKYDFSEFSILESIKLMDSVKEYKSIASLNEIEMMANICSKEIDQIKSVKVVYEDKKKIGSNIEEVKNEQKTIKVKFIKEKEQIDSLNYIKDTIESEINNQKEIVDEMYSKATYFEKQISKQREIIGHRKIISSFLRIAAGTLTLAFTGKSIFGVALGATMINKGLKELNRKLETREKIVINYKYEDISKQLENVKDKVEYTNLILSDSLNEIKKLKNNLSSTFKKYDKVLPEYLKTVEKVNDLENKLKDQQTKIIGVNKKIELEQDLNKEKMKKIGKIN